MMFEMSDYLSPCDYTPEESIEEIYYKLMRRVVGTPATKMAFAELAEMAASGTEEEGAAAKLVMRDIYER
jgi:hypothetical protein